MRKGFEDPTMNMLVSRDDDLNMVDGASDDLGGVSGDVESFEVVEGQTSFVHYLRFQGGGSLRDVGRDVRFCLRMASAYRCRHFVVGRKLKERKERGLGQDEGGMVRRACAWDGGRMRVVDMGRFETTEVG